MTTPTNEPTPGDPGTQDDMSDDQPLDPAQEPGAPATGPRAPGPGLAAEDEDDSAPGQKTQ